MAYSCDHLIILSAQIRNSWYY